MQFEFDPEVLIEEVKKRPGIWDSEDVKHRSRDSRSQLWDEIIDVLLQDQTVSKTEKRELELQLQKKWKGLRDAFMKCMNNPYKQKRPYIYSKHLQFLMKNKIQNQKNQNQEAESSESEDDKKSSRWKKKRKVKIVKAEEQSDDDEISVEYLEDEDDRPVAKISKPNKSLNNEFAFANVDANNTSISADDGDKMFLLSLLPHLKTIPEEYRLNVKMEMLQVLQNAQNVSNLESLS